MAKMPAREQRVETAEDRIEDLGEFLAQLARQVATVNASTRRLERSTMALDRTIVEIRTEGEKDRKQWNKRWGELANKQGTLVEDIVAPSLRRLAAEEPGCGPVEFSAARVEQRQPGDRSKRRERNLLRSCWNCTH